MGRGPLAPRLWISPSVVLRQEPLSHFTDLPWHAEWATPAPSVLGTPLIPDWPRGVLTHPWRAAPGPPRRGRSGSCSWPWRPAPNFPTRRAPGFRGWTAAGRASTCHPQRAWHPLSESPGHLPETLWQPTPVFLPGEFHEQRSLEGYRTWGCKELDTTEQLRPSLSLSGSYSSEDSVRIILRDKNVGDFAYSGMSSVQKLIT